MTRRQFAAIAGVLGTARPSRAEMPGPRVLLRHTDPFCGVSILRSRYSGGKRPSADLCGWALEWQLTGNLQAGEHAVEALKSSPPPDTKRPARTWMQYAQLAMAYDWLYDHPAFETRDKTRIADYFLDAARVVLSTPDLARADQTSYHNYSVRYLALVQFALAAIDGRAPDQRLCAELQAHAQACLDNVLGLTQLISPEGSYHESMDYMRITWAPLTAMAELRRTMTTADPAARYSVFRNIGATYLYKLLPDGTPSREGDNEYPLLDDRDTAVIGYAVHRFKDPYAAWLLRDSGFLEAKWVIPVLEFLWNDPEVPARNPAQASEAELPRQKYFPGVGHLVWRSGWNKDATWIEFDCGPYFAKHQHLDQSQFTIYRDGYLAIDSGADYTDTESPHYLNYYRRTVAHNSVLVFDPAEHFFWSENVVPAANDGGQRMDSSRFWNTVRSLTDWERTRDLWEGGRLRTLDQIDGVYHYALGDATRAYSSGKLKRFTREMLWWRETNTLLVFDRVHSRDPKFRKAWLLHGVNEPKIESTQFEFRAGAGQLRVHSLLPEEALISKRGGAGQEFWTPGDDSGGEWGSGQNWPLENAAGEPLPSDPKLRAMWKSFWGQDFERILPSNRRNVVPGSWRVEVTPPEAHEEDLFLHAIEIGPKAQRIELVKGVDCCGAALENGPAVLFASGDSTAREATLPGLHLSALLVTGLLPQTVYQIDATGPNISSPDAVAQPGVPVSQMHSRSNENGVLYLEFHAAGREHLRITAQ